MRRFVTLVVLLLFAIPFGVSISGCSKNAAPIYCNGGDSGIVTGQVTTITLTPIVYGISLNFAEIGQVNTPSATDCKGASASIGAYVYGTTDMTIADIQPTTGRLCAGTWNRNSGGGIPDYTYCIPTSKSGTAYISASAEGVTSNPLPIFVHPVVTSIVLGGPSPGGAASITAWSIVNTVNGPTVTFTAQNSFSAGQVVTLSNFPTSTFFNGITDAAVQAAGLSTSQFTVTIPGFTEPNGSATETGLAVGPGCSSNPSTDCCPLGINPVTAPAYLANSCLSQGSTAQLVARVYAGTGAGQSNISCLAGHLQYSVQGSSSQTAVSPVLSIDQNGVATANQPGSVLISANISNAASSAGFFSTCPPASITLTAPGALTPGTPASPVVVDENNTQPLAATAVDTHGVPLTGLTLEYESTSPTTIPAGVGSIVPTLAGAASISAICQPPSCNSSSYNQIGLFGNGKPITSNSVNFSTPGTNSTVLYMASTQSLYVETRDFTQNALAQPFLLPFLPNSMIITNDGSTIYMGSSTALMVLNAVNTLAVTRVDTTSPGTVLAVSPDGSTIVISDPIKQVTTLENSSGSVITTYGGVGTHAEFAPDSQTVYIAAGNQVLVYSDYTGWTNITPATTAGTPVTDVAITVPSVGAYFAGPNTTARGYCPSSTASTVGGVTTETNVFYPPADSSGTVTDRIAATNDGMHILGATVTPVPTFNDFRVQIPNGNASGPEVSIACPTGTQTTSAGGVTTGTTGGLTFSNTPYPFPLAPVTATAITGVLPTSDSTLAVITYTGSGGVLPAYAPAASGPGTMNYIKLSGTATAPLAGVVSADNTTIYVGTQTDDLVHLINRSTLTDASTLAPNLTAAPGLTVPAGSVVPVNLMVQKPRKTT
jgi:trimeric autotransporter adhesin